MKNGQLNLENIMTMYIEEIEELYQHTRLGRLCQYFMMTLYKLTKMQMPYTTISRKDTYGKT